MVSSGWGVEEQEDVQSGEEEEDEETSNTDETGTARGRSGAWTTWP